MVRKVLPELSFGFVVSNLWCVFCLTGNCLQND
eukprot:COSAG05_NODE_8571_length_691_cov_5.282095_1_plen_32_part_10